MPMVAEQLSLMVTGRTWDSRRTRLARPFACPRLPGWEAVLGIGVSLAEMGMSVLAIGPDMPIVVVDSLSSDEGVPAVT